MVQPIDSPRVLLASYSGTRGGTEVRMRQVADLLARHGRQVTVLNPPFPGKQAFVDDIRRVGGRVVDFTPAPFYMGWRLRQLDYLRVTWQALRMARRFRPGLLHAFFTWANQGIEQLWCASRAGVPTVCSVHSSFFLDEGDLTPWHRARAREAFATLRSYWAVSETALARFQTLYGEFLPRDAVAHVIYNSVDTARFQPDADAGARARGQLQIPAAAALVGSVGRLSREKRPLALLDVFARVAQARPDAHFLLLGDGDKEQAVRDKAAELGIQDRLHLVPYTDAPQSVFNALDVHVLLSRSEGFGAVTAEAMACGVPVIGTRVAGTEEVIGDSAAGALVPLGDEAAAAAEVLRMLALPTEQRQALSDAARDRALSCFDRAGWERKVMQVYADAGMDLSRPAAP